MVSISHIPREIAKLTTAQLSAAVSTSGLCSGTADDKWHPDVEPTGEAARAGYERHARRVCAPCPVRSECLVLALRTEARATGGPHGIWGGTAPWERERMLRRIKRRAARAARTVESEIGAEVARVVPV